MRTTPRVPTADLYLIAKESDMPRYFAPLFATLLMLCTAAPITAQDFSVDPVHSHVGFRIKHMGVSYVYGRFNTYQGSLTLGDEPSLSMTVQADSIDTGIAARDAHLKNADFFDVANHPTLSFTSTAIEETEDGYRVTGEFTMLGVSKEITVLVIKTGEATAPRIGHRVGYHCTFTIKRTDFGMDYGVEQGSLSDEVDITLSLQYAEDTGEEE
ncbi:MAG: YceI family protein [Phycisphaerales bacterium JB063]